MFECHACRKEYSDKIGSTCDYCGWDNFAQEFTFVIVRKDDFLLKPETFKRCANKHLANLKNEANKAYEERQKQKYGTP